MIGDIPQINFKNYNNLDTSCEKIDQPDGLNIELMDHQRTAIKGMLNLERDGYLYINNFIYFTNQAQDYKIETTVGILGDKVGSGKSLMIITLILLSKSPIKRDIFYESSKFINIKSLHTNGKCLGSNLLIVPQKIFNQWVSFFEYAPKLKLYQCKTDDNIKNLTVDDIGNFDVILIPCSKCDQINEKFGTYRWSRILIDEADSIKLSRNITLNASFIWLITGTPSGILYTNKPYLTHIFQKNKTWIINYITVKNNKDFIDASITLPAPKRVYIKCLTPAELKIIKDIIPKNIMSMINAGNSAEAIKLLNCNEDTQDNILKVVTRSITDSIENKKIELEGESKKRYHGLAQLEQEKKIKLICKSIDQLNDRLGTIKKRIYEINNELCPICMDNFTRPSIVSCCKNVFCFECLTISISNTYKCPYCRCRIGKNNISLISDKTTLRDKDITKREKIDVLLDLIQNKKDGKFLIFANFQETFKKIEVLLHSNKITYKTLKGTDDQVDKSIEGFKEGKITALLLNAQHFGAGMNLQVATDVVIYHRFTKVMEEQVMGRAQRLGRITPLTVYYLLHDNEDNNLSNEMGKFEDIDYMTYLEQLDNNKN